MRLKYEQNHDLQSSRNQRFHLPQDGSGQGKTSRLTFWTFGPFAKTPRNSSPLTNVAAKNFYPTQGGGVHTWRWDRHLAASAAHCSRLGPVRPDRLPHEALWGKPRPHRDGRRLLSRPTAPRAGPAARSLPLSPAPLRSRRAAPAERKCGRPRRAFIPAAVTSPRRRAGHAGRRRRSREDGGSGKGIPRGIPWRYSHRRGRGRTPSSSSRTIRNRPSPAPGSGCEAPWQPHGAPITVNQHHLPHSTDTFIISGAKHTHTYKSFPWSFPWCWEQ